MKIKDLKKYARLETGRIFETEKETPNLWQPAQNKTELRTREFMSGAVFVLPKKENYVNIHKNCLHLWTCENDILPDFDCGAGTI